VEAKVSVVVAIVPVDTQSGLEEAFRKHRMRVFRAAYRITGNAADAEDVLQTVFLRFARRADGEIANVSSYLYRAAMNAALDVLRARQTSGSQFAEERDAEPSSSHDHELRLQLRTALAKLNPKHAEMFVLRYVEEHSNREIAQMLNTSQAVIAVTLFRVRRQLQKDFKSR
jgi:RNA polymerase sigma-70 factor (ECF subfamily)